MKALHRCSPFLAGFRTRAGPLGAVAGLGRGLRRWAVLGVALGITASAEARDVEDCQLAWKQAVNSMLSRQVDPRMGPDGTRSEDPEVRHQAWLAVFRAACAEEKKSKRTARIMAAAAGIRALRKVDALGCERFVRHYLGAPEVVKVCAAADTDPEPALKKAL